MAENLFIEVFRALDKGVTVEEIPYNTIYTTLTDIGRVYTWPAPLQGLTLYLIKAIILQTRLSANDCIPYTHTPLTLGHLESTGDLIIHRTSIDSIYTSSIYGTVEIPFPKLSKLIALCEDVYVKSILYNICASYSSGSGGGNINKVKQYQAYDYFIRDFDAVKEMLTVTTITPPPTTTTAATDSSTTSTTTGSPAAATITRTTAARKRGEEASMYHNIQDIYHASCNPMYSHYCIKLSPIVTPIAISCTTAPSAATSNTISITTLPPPPPTTNTDKGWDRGVDSGRDMSEGPGGGSDTGADISSGGCSTPFPPTGTGNSILTDEQTGITFDYLSEQYICKNNIHNNTAFDLFKIRRDYKGEPLLLCYKINTQKQPITTTNNTTTTNNNCTPLTLHEIKTQVENIRISLINTQFYNNHICILFTNTLVDGINDSDLPDRCYLIRPEKLTDYFTPTFANRAYIYSQNWRIYINTATCEELVSLSGVSIDIASSIVMTRTEGLYRDWYDLTSRVEDVPLCIRDLVSFD